MPKAKKKRLRPAKAGRMFIEIVAFMPLFLYN